MSRQSDVAVSTRHADCDLLNHMKSMVAVDFFTVPTIRFQTLCPLGAGPRAAANCSLRRLRDLVAKDITEQVNTVKDREPVDGSQETALGLKRAIWT
jgi:hypothetical protein